MGTLFTAEKGDVDLQQDDVNGRGCYFINSGLSNDGIKGRTDRPAKTFPANTISIDFWEMRSIVILSTKWQLTIMYSRYLGIL